MKTRSYSFLDLRGFAPRDRVISPKTIRQLKKVLSEAGLRWGRWKTPLTTLLERIKRGEIMLIKENGHGLTMLVVNVAADVFDLIGEDSAHVLIEDKQIMGEDEKKRHTRHTAVVRKMARENSYDALVRCLRKKLDMPVQRIVLTDAKDHESYIEAARRLRSQCRRAVESFIVFDCGTYPQTDNESLPGLWIQRRYRRYVCITPRSLPPKLPQFEVERRTHEGLMKTVVYKWELWKGREPLGQPLRVESHLAPVD